MEKFSITMRLAEKDYAKATLLLLYRKPIVIVESFAGLYLIAAACFDNLRLIDLYSDLPGVGILLGIFFLLLPALAVFSLLRQFRSNVSLQHEITYTFNEEGIQIQGRTFKAEFEWINVIRKREVGKFLILYHSKKSGNFIDKTKLTDGQLQWIKSKIPKK
jgi:YcxB-like protein